MKTIKHTCKELPAAHLKTKRIVKRDQTTSRAYSLKEKQEGSILDFLDVENSERYQATKSQTFCNIYAHDFARLMNCYIPRVWWTNKAIEEGNTNQAKYNDNVIEMSVNLLYKWFEDYGDEFGWEEITDFKKGQQEANNGSCVVLLASNKSASRSGHITMVIPEDYKFKPRTLNGEFIPVQSQAGVNNYKKRVLKWWGSKHNKVKMYVNHLSKNEI